MPTARFDPDFRAALIALAEQAESNLGLVDSSIAMVCHACRRTAAGPAYEVSLASDATPALIGEMRRGFLGKGGAGKRVQINRLGALCLVDVTSPDLVAARMRITPA